MRGYYRQINSGACWSGLEEGNEEQSPFHKELQRGTSLNESYNTRSYFSQRGQTAAVTLLGGTDIITAATVLHRSRPGSLPPTQQFPYSPYIEMDVKTW